MRLRWRLTFLMVLLALLPSVPAALLTRQLIERSLNLGLSREVDTALEAGIRQTRLIYRRDRRALSDELDAWLASYRESGPAGLAESWAASPPQGMLRKARVVLQTQGRLEVLQAGSAESGARPATSDSPHGPPPFLTTGRDLPGIGHIDAQLAIDPQWRTDAESLAATLQVLRSLQTDRQELEQSFWLPFLGIYLLTLLASLGVAAWLARGIVGPVDRLLTAIRAVARGRWDVQVPVESHDEIGRLSEHFNTMVSTLDTQSRQLVDLEKMAGWREMARALAHEVKNPLTPIQLTVGEIRERYDGDDEQYRQLLHECTRIVIEEVESLRQVVSRFREFSRPVEPHFTVTDVNALVADVAALQRDLEIETDLDGGVGNCEVDPDRLRQVLMNLASNARQALAGREDARLRLATRPDGDHVVLVVEDNGPGIPVAERARLFEPYRSQAQGGLGLGLALVKGIVLAHQGTIEVEEGRWGGARFRIELPRSVEKESEKDHE